MTAGKLGRRIFHRAAGALLKTYAVLLLGRLFCLGGGADGYPFSSLSVISFVLSCEDIFSISGIVSVLSG